mmetsp:Transcript_26895/g.68128  ORF Transcript_26895/g.68128 Transcript_26895/m.68128 type:complete len:273 (-) Transcript_26895:137-955(-)
MGEECWAAAALTSDGFIPEAPSSPSGCHSALPVRVAKPGRGGEGPPKGEGGILAAACALTSDGRRPTEFSSFANPEPAALSPGECAGESGAAGMGEAARGDSASRFAASAAILGFSSGDDGPPLFRCEASSAAIDDAVVRIAATSCPAPSAKAAPSADRSMGLCTIDRIPGGCSSFSSALVPDGSGAAQLGSIATSSIRSLPSVATSELYSATAESWTSGDVRQRTATVQPSAVPLPASLGFRPLCVSTAARRATRTPMSRPFSSVPGRLAR